MTNWISVDDRLPLELCDKTAYETIDVIVSDGVTVCECTFCRGGAHVGAPWREFNDCMVAASSITHWMPLPDPPEVKP